MTIALGDPYQEEAVEEEKKEETSSQMEDVEEPNKVIKYQFQDIVSMDLLLKDSTATVYTKINSLEVSLVFEQVMEPSIEAETKA